MQQVNQYKIRDTRIIFKEKTGFETDALGKISLNYDSGFLKENWKWFFQEIQKSSIWGKSEIVKITNGLQKKNYSIILKILFKFFR